MRRMVQREMSDEWCNIVHVMTACDAMELSVLDEAKKQGVEVQRFGNIRMMRKSDCRKVARPLLVAMRKRQKAFRKLRKWASGMFAEEAKSAKPAKPPRSRVVKVLTQQKQAELRN